MKKLKIIYEGLYTEENVCISGTHTHSGPGGYWQYVLLQLSSPQAFVEESLNVIVDGVVESIKIGMLYLLSTACSVSVMYHTCTCCWPHIAHENMKAGSLLISSGSLTNSSVNRSPYAYEQNPDKNE